MLLSDLRIKIVGECPSFKKPINYLLSEKHTQSRVAKADSPNEKKDKNPACDYFMGPV